MFINIDTVYIICIHVLVTTTVDQLSSNLEHLLTTSWISSYLIQFERSFPSTVLVLGPQGIHLGNACFTSCSLVKNEVNKLFICFINKNSLVLRNSNE